MGPLLGLTQAELGPPPHRLPPEGQKSAKDLGKGKDPGIPPIDDEEMAGKGALKGGKFVELGQNSLRISPPFQLHHHPQPFAVGFVAKIAYPLDLPLLGLLGDGLDDRAFAHLVRDLRDHDPVVLDPGPAAEDEAALAGGIGLADPLFPHDHPAGGEIRAGQDRKELVRGGLGMVHDVKGGRDELPEVVGRDLGGHPHRDPPGPVGKQMGEPHGKDLRLLKGTVEVGEEVDGLLIEFLQKFHGDGGEARLGIAHGRGLVAVHGAEVALPIDEGITGGEGLGQAHHGLVHGHVPVGMVFPQNLAHDAGGLAVGTVWGEPKLPHPKKDPALHGLEPVPHVGDGPPADHGDGVVDVRLLHLLFDERYLHPFGHNRKILRKEQAFRNFALPFPQR